MIAFSQIRAESATSNANVAACADAPAKILGRVPEFPCRFRLTNTPTGLPVFLPKVEGPLFRLPPLRNFL